MGHESLHCIDLATLQGAATRVREPSERLIDFIYHNVRLVLGWRSADIDEATNDAYMRIVDAVGQGRFDAAREGKPSSWVKKIAIRVAIDYRRSAIRRCAKFEPLDDASEPSDPAWMDPDIQLTHYEQAALVKAYFDILDEDERAVIVLRYYGDDLSQQEIANTLDVPIGTVKSRLHRAESKLCAAIAKTFHRERRGQ